MLLIKFLGGLVVAKKLFHMQTVRLALRPEQPTCIEVLICIYNLINDETFILWDTFHWLYYTIMCNLVTSNYIGSVVVIGFRNYIHSVKYQLSEVLNYRI